MNRQDFEDIISGLSPSPMTLGEQMLADASHLLAPPGEGLFARYRNDPVGYARDVLKVTPWSMQEDVLRLIASPPNDEWHCKLAIGAGTSAGKTFVGGVIINWMYDCRGPCIVLTTAPSQRSVVDLLWKEVRLQRARAASQWGIGSHDFIGPQAPAMKRAPDWSATGIVANKPENFKGRHVQNMCFMFDEAVGMSDLYFQTTKTMFQPGGDMLWICLYNPTDTASAMYQEIIHPESDWYVMELSNLEHPNVVAELRGEPRPIPAAVTLEQVESGIREECEQVEARDALASDFEWPPGSGKWFRPNSHFEWSALGRWPSGDDDALWSDALWKSCSEKLTWEDVRIEIEEVPRIGCDVATKGIDKTDIHVSWGNYSVHHESRGQVKPMVTCGRLIELAELWAAKANESRKRHGMQPISGKNVSIKIDDDGTGGAIGNRLREQGYLVYMVGAATKPNRQNRYPNKRSELWFETADRAKKGHLLLGLLPRKTLAELQRQAMAPLWTPNSAGHRVIEEKEQMRNRLGRSPDGMDAVNLSYYVYHWRAPEIIHVEQPGFMERQETRQEERRGPSWMGRGRGRSGLFRR